MKQMNTFLLLLPLYLFPVGSGMAQADFAAVDDAFRLSASRASDGGVRLSWEIQAGYYLYRDKARGGRGSEGRIKQAANYDRAGPGQGGSDVRTDVTELERSISDVVETAFREAGTARAPALGDVSVHQEG